MFKIKAYVYQNMINNSKQNINPEEALWRMRAIGAGRSKGEYRQRWSKSFQRVEEIDI